MTLQQNYKFNDIIEKKHGVKIENLDKLNNFIAIWANWLPEEQIEPIILLILQQNCQCNDIIKKKHCVKSKLPVNLMNLLQFAIC